MRLSIYVLGDFQVSVDNQSITRKFRTDKERALFAYLAIEGKRPISRETLAELFWPDRPEGMARANLRQALLGVRNAIEDKRTPQPFLLVSDEAIQINHHASFWLDADAFSARLQSNSEHDHKTLETCPTCIQQLQEAVDLYRQDFLSGLYVENSQTFQEWAFFHREQFKRYLLEMLDLLSEIHKNQGDWETMQKYAWLYIKHAPLEEQAYRRLMELLALSGRRSAALEQYQNCVRMLQQELGVEPSPETVALFEKIRKGRPIGLDDDGELQTPGGLPRPMTEFIGREEELDFLARCFTNPACQLISISGLPGVGKSRLAVEAALRSPQTFPDGVFYLSLEGVHSEELFFPALARSLGLTVSLNNPKVQISRYLETRRCLVLIDQFDEMHHATHLLMELLQTAFQIKILVTSRQSLNLLAATPLPLEGLPYPQNPADDQALQSPAVQLFLKRARHSRQDFNQHSSWLYYVLEVCQAVDGLPLALELAADRLRELPLPNIVDSLHKDLSVLSTSLQDIPARHRSMQKTIGSAWEKLEDETQRHLLYLSIFPCSFTSQAAEAVCNTGAISLAFLNDNSLLLRTGYGRYAFNPLIRQFAKARLSSQVERKSALQMSFGNYYLEFFHQKASQMQNGRSANQVFAAIDEELGNIYFALDWALWVGEHNLIQQAVADFKQYQRLAQSLAVRSPEAGGRLPERSLPDTDLFSRENTHAPYTNCIHHYRLVDANNAMLMTDAEGQIIAANYQAQQLSGLALGALLGMNLGGLGVDISNEGGQNSATFDARFLHHSGASSAVEVLCLPGRAVSPGHHLLILKKKVFESHPEGATELLDPLTGLPNLLAFTERLRKTISKASVQVEQFGVLVLHLQGMQTVEQDFGLETKRLCLQEAAGRMRQSLRQRDFLAYLGDSEFALLMERLPNPQAMEIVAAKLSVQFQTPLELSEHSLKLELSSGAGIYPIDGDNAEFLLEFARTSLERQP